MHLVLPKLGLPQRQSHSAAQRHPPWHCARRRRRPAQSADAYDFAEAVNVLAQLDKAFWDGLASAKWAERRDALQRLKSLASTPKVRGRPAAPPPLRAPPA